MLTLCSLYRSNVWIRHIFFRLNACFSHLRMWFPFDCMHTFVMTVHIQAIPIKRCAGFHLRVTWRSTFLLATWRSQTWSATWSSQLTDTVSNQAVNSAIAWEEQWKSDKAWYECLISATKRRDYSTQSVGRRFVLFWTIFLMQGRINIPQHTTDQCSHRASWGAS